VQQFEERPHVGPFLFPDDAMSVQVPIVVLDTNVCIDVFVFRSALSAPLREDLEAGRLRAVTDAACADEWQRVLALDSLSVAPSQRAAAAMASTRLLVPIKALGDAAPSLVRPPRCEDPDDQKFIELACLAGATVLFSRDRALLKLSRRLHRDFGFPVIEPAQWPGAARWTPFPAVR
jgi:predicted nucleic acid-binding protein